MPRASRETSLRFPSARFRRLLFPAEKVSRVRLDQTFLMRMQILRQDTIPCPNRESRPSAKQTAKHLD